MPRSELIDESVRRTLAAADQNARRLGISRRAFLRSSAGMALTLTTLAACSKQQSAGRGPDPTTGTTGRPGGTFSLPPEASIDSTVATTALSPTSTTASSTASSTNTSTSVPQAPADFVVDVQTHLLEYAPGSVTATDIGFIQAACGPDAAQCMGIDAWLDLVLGGSDTTVAVISAIPATADPNPLSIDVMERARRAAEQIGCSGRVLIQAHATPTLGELPLAMEAMTEVAATHDIAAWKVYTHEGPPWRLDDAIGDTFLEQVRTLGQHIVCVHKGLGPAAASPVDVGPAAAAHPDLDFCIYHSGFEAAVTEGPYPGPEAGAAAGGVDRLISSCQSSGIASGGNVYAELGSTWWNLIQRPDEAAHVLGKLLVAFGGDNILWGTDSIWYGSPQAQIDAFRAFEITPEYQERFGYPALTSDLKAKILGLNAARLYGIDPTTAKCALPAADRQALRAELPPVRPTGPTTAGGAKRRFADDHPWFR